jgi:hypothetical protein
VAGFASGQTAKEQGLRARGASRRDQGRIDLRLGGRLDFGPSAGRKRASAGHMGRSHLKNRSVLSARGHLIARSRGVKAAGSFLRRSSARAAPSRGRIAVSVRRGRASASSGRASGRFVPGARKSEVVSAVRANSAVREGRPRRDFPEGSRERSRAKSGPSFASERGSLVVKIGPARRAPARAGGRSVHDARKNAAVNGARADGRASQRAEGSQRAAGVVLGNRASRVSRVVASLLIRVAARRASGAKVDRALRSPGLESKASRLGNSQVRRENRERPENRAGRRKARANRADSSRRFASGRRKGTGAANDGARLRDRD